jgi:transcriptional regulator with XRE-family HTH domain
MATQAETRTLISDFIKTRRERVAPGDVGIAFHDSRRRVKGLRREEVAMLAGISVEYYTRLERGDATGASPSVVAAVSRVLRLNDIEREHLQRLFMAAERPEEVRIVVGVRPEVQRLLDALSDVPAFVVNRRLDIVGSNELGRALYSPLYEAAPAVVNTARFQFLDQERSRRFWLDWEAVADSCVAILRAEIGVAARSHETDLLINELLTEPDFEHRWRSHDVHRHSTGFKRIFNPVVGELLLPYEHLTLDADPDLSFMIYNPAPASAAYDAVRVLQLAARDSAIPSQP